MVSKMKFDVKVVREYLLEHAFVLTVRGYDYGIMSEAVTDCVGAVDRLRLRQVRSIEDIRGFERYSGFTSVEDWWHAISGFKAQNGWLYRVSVKKNSGKSDPEPPTPCSITWKCQCGTNNRYCELYQPEEMTDEGIASAYWYVQCSMCGKRELI